MFCLGLFDFILFTAIILFFCLVVYVVIKILGRVRLDLFLSKREQQVDRLVKMRRKHGKE